MAELPLRRSVALLFALAVALAPATSCDPPPDDVDTDTGEVTGEPGPQVGDALGVAQAYCDWYFGTCPEAINSGAFDPDCAEGLLDFFDVDEPCRTPLHKAYLCVVTTDCADLDLDENHPCAPELAAMEEFCPHA